METEIKDRQDSIKFILAGNSSVTFVNSQTGNRFTYKIKKSKDSDLYFVNLLNSPGNYVYIGVIVPDGFRHGKKSSVGNNAQSVKVFDYVYSNLIRNTLANFIQIWHEGKCGKCGKELTDPTSIMLGLGPFCAKKIKSEKLIFT